MEARASAKYLRGSAQKARLVIDMIRGKNVNQALAILQYTNKRAADGIEKCVRSAIANATEAAEKAQGVRVEPGDILVVRTGYYARRLAEGPVNPMVAGTPALHVACCPWLRERGVAMIGTDTHNDIAPLPYPSLGNSFHVVSLVAMGLWLIDNMNLEEVARAAAERKRWEFLLTVGPLRLKNVTGSPVNPIAVF